MNLENGFKYSKCLVYGNLGRRYDGHFPLYSLIDYKILSCQFADELNKHVDIHIIKINRYELLRRRRFFPTTGLRQGDIGTHHRSETDGVA